MTSWHVGLNHQLRHFCHLHDHLLVQFVDRNLVSWGCVFMRRCSWRCKVFGVVRFCQGCKWKSMATCLLLHDVIASHISFLRTTYLYRCNKFTSQGSVTITWHHSLNGGETKVSNHIQQPQRWPQHFRKHLQLGFVSSSNLFIPWSSTSTSIFFFRIRLPYRYIKMIRSTFTEFCYTSPCATSRATYSCIKMIFFGNCLRHSWIAPIWAFLRTCWAMPGWIEAHWLVDTLICFTFLKLGST